MSMRAAPVSGKRAGEESTSWRVLAQTDSRQENLSVLIVAGETSGDDHAAGLVRELKEQIAHRRLEFFGSGGKAMAAQGVELFARVGQLAAVGPLEAAGKLLNYWRLYRKILKECKKRKPALAVLVDFPDFNLRLASRLKAMGIPVCYFISPQVWAWRRYRLKQIRRNVDLMLVIFPFEEEFFRKHGVQATYVGNPTARRLSDQEAGTAPDLKEPPVVALLPGSRTSEVKRILPIQLDAAGYIAGRMQARFRVVRAPEISREELDQIYQTWQKGKPQLDLEIRDEGSDSLLARADCAIVKSGTSTLEALLHVVPFAMVYKMSWVSWILLKPLMRTEMFCLANLIAGRRVVPEFLQHQADGAGIGSYILELLQNPNRCREVSAALERVREKLGVQDAYRTGAQELQGFLEKRVFST